MASAPDNSSLLSDQDTNQFLVYAGIEPQISYTSIQLSETLPIELIGTHQ